MNVLDEIQAELKVKASEPKQEEPKNEVEVVAETPETIPPVIEKEITPEISQNISTPEKQVEVVESNFANEELAEANAFIKNNPTKTFEDYKALKVPTSEVNENDLIAQFLSEKEGLTKSEVALRLKKMELADESDPDFEDFADADSIEYLEAKAERERTLKNASEWREDYVSKSLAKPEEIVPTEKPFNAEDFMKSERDNLLKQEQEYLETVYTALPEFNEIPLDINGNKVSFVPSENFKSLIKGTMEDISSTAKEFFDETTGKLKDPKGYMNEVAWINPNTRAEMLKFTIDQAIAKDRLENASVRRNVNLNGVNKSSENVDTSIPEAVNKIINGGYSTNSYK